VVAVVSGNKVELAQEILGNGAETVEDVTETSRIVLSADLAENSEDRKSTITNFGVLVVDTSKRNRDTLDPLTDGISVILARVDDLLVLVVEVTESNDLVSALLGGRSDTKDVILTKSVGSLDESLANRRAILGESNKLDIISLGEELLESLSVLKRLGSGASLSTHVLHDTVSITGTLVITLDTLVEDIKSGITVNAETISKFSLISSINFSEDDTITVLCKNIGSLDIVRSQTLAVTTPWGIELNEDGFSLINNLIEILIGENNNLAVLFS